MLKQNERDDYYAQDHTNRSNVRARVPQYDVLVSRQVLDEQSNLLDRVIDFAFETLGARHLQLRVYDDA